MSIRVAVTIAVGLLCRPYPAKNFPHNRCCYSAHNNDSSMCDLHHISLENSVSSNNSNSIILLYYCFWKICESNEFTDNSNASIQTNIYKFTTRIPRKIRVRALLVFLHPFDHRLLQLSNFQNMI